MEKKKIGWMLEPEIMGEIVAKSSDESLEVGDFLKKIFEFYKKYENKDGYIELMSSLIDKKNKLLAQKIKLIDDAFEVMKIAKEMKIGEGEAEKNPHIVSNNQELEKK